MKKKMSSPGHILKPKVFGTSVSRRILKSEIFGTHGSIYEQLEQVEKIYQNQM